MRETYAAASRATGVAWEKRNYDRKNWMDADPVNRALSCANSCLYGLCHAAILAAGYSPGLGFIHCGKQLSFVYDIADLYKTEVSIPVAFRIAKFNPPDIERAVRLECRDQFRKTKLLSRIVPDIQKLLAVDDELARNIAATVVESFAPDDDPAMPTSYGHRRRASSRRTTSDRRARRLPLRWHTSRPRR
jgi:CRISPR-associated protein Cas1